MKNILLTLSAATVLLAACNTKKNDALDTDKRIVFSDTSLMKPADNTTDIATAGNLNPVTAPDENKNIQPQIRTVTKVIRVIEKQPAQQPVVTATPPPAVEPTVSVPAPVAEAPKAEETATTGSVGSTDVVTAPAPEEVKKKKDGWSDAAKGATIGGVGGAIAGAVIGKGAKGAIIGGVLGAAGGYIIGRKGDKKSGRADLTSN